MIIFILPAALSCAISRIVSMASLFAASMSRGVDDDGVRTVRSEPARIASDSSRASARC
jgi:ABC-type Fe2+-enterobactin transport system substrate-binding protein